tara:strand:+ start:857 stop:1096 length:240 start_codon:yes stop_codon:yes gene_type:complete
MYNTRPTRTGGSPINELEIKIKKFFPKKFVTANNAARGKDISIEVNKAIKEILRDKVIISNNSLSNFKISLKDSNIMEI